MRFAFALLPDPDLLVLDEPTAAMDVRAASLSGQSMRGWVAQGRTVLFATHYLDEAEDVADRVVLLRGGRVVADGTGAQVRALAGGRTLSATVPRPLTRPARLPAVCPASRPSMRPDRG